AHTSQAQVTDEAAHPCTSSWRSKEEDSEGQKAGEMHLCVPCSGYQGVKSYFHQ
ncbi:hypothetical protein HGM15179_002475, partial [Zosterops borbonicus]